MVLHVLCIIHLLDTYIIPKAAGEDIGSLLVLKGAIGEYNLILYFVKRRNLKCIPLFSVLT